MFFSEQAIRNCIFGIKCNADWEKMKVVRGKEEDEDGQIISEVRFCNSCHKEVYQCCSDSELLHNIHLNRCIRIDATPWTPLLMGSVVIEKDN